MSKRKVSAERSTATKETTRRPSITSIQTRVNAVPLQRKHSPSGKSPSVEISQNQGTMAKLSKTMLATEETNAVAPKTRFNSQDRCKELRSNSSPRLKSFPAERIRKFDNPALFNTKPIRAMMSQAINENSGRYSVPATATYNHEYGDQNRGMHRGNPGHSQMPENVCQQEICPNHPMHQPIPQADGAVTYRVHGPDRHRPNVPHGHQSHLSAMTTPSSMPYVHNAGAPVAPSSATVSHGRGQQSQRIASESMNYVKPDWVTDEKAEVTDLEKQPVGGRNAVMHRKALMQEKQLQQGQTHSHPMIYSNSGNPNSDRPMPISFSQNNMQPLPYLTQENPHQLYQQFQNNMAQQQQMQQRAFNHQMQMMSGQQQAHHQAQGNQGAYYNYYTQKLPERPAYPYGMTSPQDASVNQARSGQNATSMQQVQQQNTAYPINQPNGIMPGNQMLVDNPNVRSQIRPYTINVVDDVKSQNVTYGQPNHSHGQMAQMNQPAVPGQPYSNYFPYQNVTPQGQVTQQMVPPENPGTQGNHQAHVNRTKSNLKFSPKMIRDQELLVATMKQQGISDDLMRRQFDTLLNEQRRQLEYLQQFHQEVDLPETRKQDTRRKLQMDEKPEWMAHITPPRISYSDLEKMSAKLKEQNDIQQQQQMNENQMVDYTGMQQNANNQQLMVPSAHFHDQFEQRAYPNWQQQPGLPPGSAYTYTPYQPSQNQNQHQHQNPHQHQHQHQHQHLANNVTHPQYSTYWPSQQQQQQQQQLQHLQNPQHPQHQQYQQYQQNLQQAYYQQPQQVSWQRDHMQGEENTHFFKKAVSLNDLNLKSGQPSSLLKLRLYKDVIRPQKRNNGLQDPETIQKAFEMLNNPESHKGLEYLANLNRKKQIARLNGMQNPMEVTSDLIPRPPLDSSAMIPQRVISANGLENTRNPNNPLPQPLTFLKRSELSSSATEYPRQKQNNPRNRYSLMAEREDGTIAPTVQYSAPNTLQQAQQYNQLQQQNYQRVIPYNDKNPLSALNQSIPYKLDGSPPEHYHQMQHYYRNKQNMVNNNGQGDVPSLNKPDTSNVTYRDHPGGDTADLSHFKDNGQTQNNMTSYAPYGATQRSNGGYNPPEISEAKTIGGVTYLARKSDYIPNQPAIPENTLTANKYVQPAVIY